MIDPLEKALKGRRSMEQALADLRGKYEKQPSFEMARMIQQLAAEIAIRRYTPKPSGRPDAWGGSQISELVFAHHACVSVYFALYLILKNASSFGQLANNDEGFTATGNLAHVRGKANLLSDGEFV
jgi:hypothetical protein